MSSFVSAEQRALGFNEFMANLSDAAKEYFRTTVHSIVDYMVWPVLRSFSVSRRISNIRQQCTRSDGGIVFISSSSNST